MSTPDVVVLVVACALVTVAIKSAGPLLLGDTPLPPLVARAVWLLGPALLAGLAATQTLADGDRLALSPHVAGVAVGTVALVARVPLLGAAALAMATAAGLAVVA
jgi:branched-subunit amino acid transport protein